MREFKHPDRIERALAAIVEDRRSGASELARRAVKLFASASPREGIALSAYLRAVRRLTTRVRRARPAMAPIEGALGRLVFDLDAAASQFDSTKMAHAELRRLARRLGNELDDLGDQIARRFKSRFGRLQRPLLISYSSRVTQAIETLRRPYVTVCESRPAFEGRRTARLLQETAASVELITEAQIAIAMDNCDSAVLGCDAIYPDGSIVNKTGSYLLALAAQSKRRPVIVLGDTYKIHQARTGPHETHPPAQVWRGRPAGITVRNVAFEGVPDHLIDYIVMEHGVFRAARIESIWETARSKRAIL
jgi:translation initiation factor eIF-2B subunit delta